MIKTKIFLAIFVSFALLSGCADVPDSIRQQTAPTETLPPVVTVPVTDESGVTVGTETVEFEPVERGSLDEIRLQLEYDMQRSYKNLTVVRARVGDADSMPTYDVKTGRNENFDIYAFAEQLLGDQCDVYDESLWTHEHYGDPFYKEYPVSDKPELQPDGKVLNQNMLTYDNDSIRVDRDRDVWLGYTSNTKGEIWGSEIGCKAPDGIYFYDSFDIVARYDLDYEQPDASLSYKVYGGEEWNVLEAIQFAEDYFNNEIGLTDPQKYIYTVKMLLIKSISDDAYGYQFVMQRRDEAGNYIDTERNYDYEQEAVENGKPFIAKSSNMSYILWCAGKEQITYFTKGAAFTYEAETDSGDSLLSLGVASDILSEKLAPNINLSLTAELNYVLVCKSYPYFQIWEYPAYYDDLMLTSCELELRPYWCFRTGMSPYTGNMLEVYFVDARTGEVVVMTNGICERR